MLNAMSPLKFLNALPRLPDFSNNIFLIGETKQIKTLDKKGTLIFVPTHLSNLDSIIMGYSVYMLGLPPLIYGAGLNLFHNPFMGFFMQRLGAYKVDRLKKHSLYKDVLKEYATATLQMGYNNLFFPGGTRIRSGAIESKLKLGLLGTGLQSYYNDLCSNNKEKRYYIIPCTLNYQLVLEAQTLIEDYLKEQGKSRFIITDDEFSMPSKVYSFMRNLISMDAGVFINFGRALDPFGNKVDDEGNSIDGMGRLIDIEKYFVKDNKLKEDKKRNNEYTRELGQKIVESYKCCNVISPTHVLAWTVFELLKKRSNDADFYRFLRETSYEQSIPMIEIYKKVEEVLKKIKIIESKEGINLSGLASLSDVTEVVDKALRLFGSYHTKAACKRKGDRLFPRDMNLLYYYRNRLSGYNLKLN